MHTLALRYPFEHAPGNAQAVDITPAIKWLRTPLPLSLNHINCYLLKDGDGWCVVDTGMNSDAAREQWRAVIESQLQGAPITRVIATHHHPDHVGLAGWLCDTWRAPLFMTETEYFYTRTFASPIRTNTYWEVDRYFQLTGMTDAAHMDLQAHTDFKHMVSEVPGTYHQIKDQQILRIGEHDWQAVTTRGHAPEHLALYCASLDLLISGDQVLPKITPNIHVSPTAPDDNPLDDWFAAHRKVAARVPDTVTVLPAHQMPFVGLHQRLAEVVEHHHERLDRILQLCEKPMHAQDITRQLFTRELNAFQNFLAVGECLAHLNYLLGTGRVRRSTRENVFYYNAE